MNNPTTNHPVSPAPVKADRYQSLRDAIAGPIIRSPRIAFRAAGSICVGDTRPVDTVEDLERGLHIEILGGENTEAEAQFIAACDPDTIREMLAERDRLATTLQAEVEALQAEVDGTIRELRAERDQLAAENARLREALKEAEDAMRFVYTSCATLPQEPQHIQNAAWRRIVNALTKARAALADGEAK